jgi:hypothetical protein
MEEHVKVVHQGVKRFECTACGYQSYFKPVVQRHIDHPDHSTLRGVFPCEKKGVCIYKVVYTKFRAVRRVEGLVGIVTVWKIGRLTAHARPHRLSRGERDDSRAEFQLGQRHLPPSVRRKKKRTI